MKFKKSARVEAGLHQIDIAPLIDCIFLLLIFFMLTSNFVVMPGINVKLPKALTSEQVDVKSLTLVVSSEDIVYLQDKPYSFKEIEDLLKQNKYDSIFIKADRDASLGVVVRIWDICKKLGIEKIGIATTYE
ncbi:MAG: biopolymer transporter ExbD [Candidatus Omnitrophica bacterium]|nr:biopolymer transporter ExbD [Candidatus Omnitrophota bacterium]MDD5430373.1 biopolymer transporter ExbD [Candidatus Omnitrophota bacterium]